MTKIEKLTPEQIARFPEFVERWTKIGLCADPADRPRAEAAIRESYRLAGLKEPSKIVWCGSPLSQGLTRAVVLDKKLLKDIGDSVGDSVWASVRDSVGDSVRDSVWASVRDSVGDSVRASVWASVRDSVRDSVGDSVWASVGDSVWDSVRDSVGDSVRDSVWASVWDSVYGAHDANWLAFYRYFYEACGLTAQTEKLAGLWELAQSAGWGLPHQNICWISERHNILQRDERGRLHNLVGPACTYPDGWAIYAVHGVRIPADIIEKPESLTKDRIFQESNAEIRRVMIERVGNEQFLSMVAAKPIHEDQRGKLYRIDLEGDEAMTLVQVVNSTPEPTGENKIYTLRVPPNIQRASEAVAWSFGLTEQDYNPAVET